MAKVKKKKKEVKLFCDRCGMILPHLLLKRIKTNYIEQGRVIQCKQCKEKTVVDTTEIKLS